ncbi:MULTISPECIES: hypothetical protein [Alicyclobacillus]|uniref:Uncharacterized protein n=1 Tax=Alicyclobacillus acidoterrestris (strain ATCC 49025 / DSM 3922 / CIP 106132 / NCIMB 13137 / GD3B) TaxID=1356854 RepID=A0A9E6ZQN4_ALIAG|nr:MULTISPECIES: hypothetical protein [Alicyclobacillus]UNO47359.1 hypothetical protein K1I37_11530 [Alicyclobacillus acidoterrestris]
MSRTELQLEWWQRLKEFQASGEKRLQHGAPLGISAFTASGTGPANFVR